MANNSKTLNTFQSYDVVLWASRLMAILILRCTMHNIRFLIASNSYCIWTCIIHFKCAIVVQLDFTPNYRISETSGVKRSNPPYVPDQSILRPIMSAFTIVMNAHYICDNAFRLTLWKQFHVNCISCIAWIDLLITDMRLFYINTAWLLCKMQYWFGMHMRRVLNKRIRLLKIVNRCYRHFHVLLANIHF